VSHIINGKRLGSICWFGPKATKEDFQKVKKRIASQVSHHFVNFQSKMKAVQFWWLKFKLGRNKKNGIPLSLHVCIRVCAIKM